MILEANYFSDEGALNSVSGLLFVPLDVDIRANYYDIKSWQFAQTNVTFSNAGSTDLYYRFFGSFTFPEENPTWGQVTGNVDYFLELNYDTHANSYDRIGFVDVAQEIQTLLNHDWESLLSGADELRGGDNDDILASYAGDDLLFGGGGYDLLYGGDGTDIAYYSGKLSEYALYANTNIVDPFSADPSARLNGWDIADTVRNRDGGDTLTGVERIYFSDLVLGFDEITATTYSLYEAAFNREPDTAGLGFWIAQREAGMAFEDVSARFINSIEFISLYGENPTDGEFLNALYYNILDREADPDGLAFWLEEIAENPAKTWARVLADFALSQENQDNLADIIANGMPFESWFS